MRHLDVAAGLKIPVELAARTQCVFGQKGSGKTSAAVVMVEEMLAHDVQVVALDPTGVWWGLQSAADGTASRYEILVMGGAHADVPLEPDAGEVVADFLIETGQSVVLDVSQFESQAAQDRFALAFATRLYRQKAHDRANLHVFLDEADQFAPLKPQKGQERLLHAWDLIVRLGRSRGLGLTAISQRPAVVHTNIRNNVDLLTCLRVTGLQDFKALREWTGIYATPAEAKTFLEDLPTLADGEAFFWSPAWLKVFQRATVRPKSTFDSTRTPKPGERPVEPRARREPDLEKLTAAIRASVQRAKDNDPRELKKKLAHLERQLLAVAAAPAPVDLQAEFAKGALAERARLRPALDELSRSQELLSEARQLILHARGRVEGDGMPAPHLREPRRPPRGGPGLADGLSGSEPHPTPSRRPLPVTGNGQAAGPRPAEPPAGREGLSKTERAVLDAAASFPGGATRQRISTFSGRSIKSSSFQACFVGGSAGGPRSSLVQRGLLRPVGDRYEVTEAGRGLARPTTGVSLSDWVGKLTPTEGRVLLALANAHPRRLTRAEVAAQVDQSERSSSFQAAFPALRDLGLVEGRDDFGLSAEMAEQVA